MANLTHMLRVASALAIIVCATLYFAALTGKASDSTSPQRAVVVELFTSEGCSSCPPADELLARMREALAARNMQVIPLGLHVDYWNSMGWKDRFSSAEFTRRQEDYARSLGVNGPYTPQMVVDGSVEFVGNDARRAEQAIASEAGRPERAEVKLSADEQDHLDIAVKSSGEASGNVMLAITEDNLATKVGAGENNGHTLRHAAVVRQLRKVGQLREGTFSLAIPLRLQRDWKRQDLRAVVFVQDGVAGKIEGAASVALTGQPR